MSQGSDDHLDMVERLQDDAPDLPCGDCQFLAWKEQPFLYADAYCQKFRRVVGDDLRPATGPTRLDDDCYQQKGR